MPDQPYWRGAGDIVVHFDAMTGDGRLTVPRVNARPRMNLNPGVRVELVDTEGRTAGATVERHTWWKRYPEIELVVDRDEPA